MVWKIPGVPESSRPPVLIGKILWDANSRDEYERRIALVSNEDGTTEDRDFMLALGMTAELLLNEAGWSDEEIMTEFGVSREELSDSLGLPTEEEVIEFGKQCAVLDAVHN